MDKELQTYTDQIMDQQQYRSGIFSNILSPILNAMAAFRFSANERGALTQGGKSEWIENSKCLLTKLSKVKSIETVFPSCHPSFER